MGGMCYLSLVIQLRAMLAVGLALCAYSCEPATTPPLTSQRFAPLAGVVRLVGSPSAGHISAEGTLSLVVRPVDARTILQTWTRDLADPVVGEADGERFLHFRLEMADLPLSMTEVVLEALVDARERSIVASTAAAQVREVQLRLRLNFIARTPSGRLLIPRAELLAARDLSTTESAVLAKGFEEAELYRELQTDVVQQVLRRLASIVP